jgi:hypothetical protein
MTTLGLNCTNDYLLVEFAKGLYVLDTGCPKTFGEAGTLAIGNEVFPHSPNYFSYDAEKISRTVGHRVNGIVGVDVLNRFDLVVDVPKRTVTFSAEPVDAPGVRIPLTFPMSLPHLVAHIEGLPYTLVFDTGATISYWNDARLSSFATEGCFNDHHPQFGAIATPTWRVPMRAGNTTLSVRCGQLPERATVLMQNGVAGVLSNEIMKDAPVAYLPRRSLLVVPG